MSGSSSPSGSSGEQHRRNRGRNVRGRTVRLHQLFPNDPVIAAAAPPPAPEFPPPAPAVLPPVAPAIPELPPHVAPAVPELHIFLPAAAAAPAIPELPPHVAPAVPELHIFLPPAAAPEIPELPAAPAPDLFLPPAVLPELLPALPAVANVLPILPAPVADAFQFIPVQVPPNPPAPAVPELLPALLVGDPAFEDIVPLLPHLPAQVADILPNLPVQVPQNPPAQYFDIPGFPEFPLEDNQGYRHMFNKLLSQSDINSELIITGQNVHVFCTGVLDRIDGRNKLMARLTVLLLGGIIRDGQAIVRLGNLHNVASLLWQPVLGEFGVNLILQQPVFAWYKIEQNQILHIVIQVRQP